MRMEKMETDINEEDEDSALSLLEFVPPGVLLEIFKFLEWNDLCQLSRTCTKFRDICQSATLWLQLRSLDFRNCSIPDGDKILQVLQRTTNADTLILADAITDQTAQQEEGRSEEEENIVGPDKFLLNVLRTCHNIRNLTLYMHEITDRAVEAISAKCTQLVKLCIHDNLHIRNRSIVELVSASETLTSLHIENCQNLSFLPLKHTDPTKQLKLTHVSLIGQMMVLHNIQDLILGCPSLTHLDLSSAQHLQSFNGGLWAVKTAMDSLVDLILLNCDDLLEISLPYCPNLNKLDTRNCRRLEEITVTLPLLQDLQVSGCPVINKVELGASDLKEFCCADSEDLETLRLGSDNLTSLDISHCTKLDAEQLVSCVANKANLRDLNIEGCKGIPPVDLDEKILPIFTGLESLVYGGHSWSSVRLKSNTLRKLTFSSCNNTTGLPLNMPMLQELTLSKCRDFGEQDLMDGLVYGKLIPQKIMSVDILKDESLITPPFTGNTGTPALNVLRLHSLPGLHGEVISHWLKSFSHMTVLELVCCNFVTHLLIEDLPSLNHLKLESCSRLNKLQVNRIQTLETLDVRWCSMVQSTELTGENIKSLDLVGTNFAHLTINCDKLTSLHLAGVCTQPEHTLCLRCHSLSELSIIKCDRLSDKMISDILQHCPVIENLTLVGSLSLGSLSLSGSMQSCSLTGHRVLREISVPNTVQIKHLTLNNLPKFTPADRQSLLQHCEGSLKELEVRAIRGETNLSLSLKYLTSLTLDQGIQLDQLNINCPRLQYLRIQGCPKLRELSIQLEKLSQLQVYHSTPLLALRCLQLWCKKAAHLARVLSFYCPKLEELTLRQCNVEFKLFDQLCQALPQLQTVKMIDCEIYNVPSKETQFVIERTEDSSSRANRKNLMVCCLPSEKT